MSGLRLGYAALNTRLPSPARTVRLANAIPTRLRELLSANLEALEAVPRWNAEHDIRVFPPVLEHRPAASHPAPVVDEHAARFEALERLMRDEGMRLSTHPGQYTVLGSPTPAVMAAAIAELDYHGRMLSEFGLDSSHKVVIHLGGA